MDQIAAENANKNKAAGNTRATAGVTAGAISGAVAGNAEAIAASEGNVAAATTIPHSPEGALAAKLLQKKACAPSNVTLTHKKVARGGLSAPQR